MENWLTAVRGTARESTFTRYYRNVYSYLVPLIGSHAILEIDGTLVGCVKKDLLSCGGKRGGGLSEKTVSDIFSTLKMVLLYASEQGHPTMNIAFVRTPRRKKKDFPIILQEMVERLEETLLSSDDRVCPGILLALHTGIRNGELCGLGGPEFQVVYGADTANGRTHCRS